MYRLHMKICHTELLKPSVFPKHQCILNLVIIVTRKSDVIKKDCVIIRNDNDQKNPNDNDQKKTKIKIFHCNGVSVTTFLSLPKRIVGNFCSRREEIIIIKKKINK